MSKPDPVEQALDDADILAEAVCTTADDQMPLFTMARELREQTAKARVAYSALDAWGWLALVAAFIVGAVAGKLI